jgi:hypothetical protein
MATPIASTNGLQAGAAPAIKVTQNTPVTGQAALNVNYGGKSFATEIIVISEKLYVTGKDKDGKTVFLDTGIKTKETNPEKLKTLAEGYLKSPNPNANVTEFFAKVAPTKVEKSSVEVGFDVLTGKVTSEVTVPISSKAKFVSNMGPGEFTASVSVQDFIFPNMTGTGGVNVLTGRPYGTLSYKMQVGDNITITPTAGYNSAGAAEVGIKFRAELP